jgi:hypothetical protein
VSWIVVEQRPDGLVLAYIAGEVRAACVGLDERNLGRRAGRIGKTLVIVNSAPESGYQGI